MGCDIHPVVQWLDFQGLGYENWVSMGEMDWSRSYGLFDRLAGVRCRHGGDTCPELKILPRGLPAFPPSCLVGNDDLHSHAWLTLSEFKDLAGSYCESWPEIAGAVAMMEKIESTGHRTRLVFAFDN